MFYSLSTFDSVKGFSLSLSADPSVSPSVRRPSALNVNKSSKDRIWSAIPDALLGVIS